MSESQCTKFHEPTQQTLILPDLRSVSDAELFAGIRALMAEIAVNSFELIGSAPICTQIRQR